MSGFGFEARLVIAFKAFFECVLSEGFAVAWDCLLLLAVDGSCAWRGLG